jgi:putative nucleotidyltransferase with HDIG domain
VLLHEPPPLAELPQEMEGDIAIPFHAVAALFSALSFRDAATAEHSRRVADLCVQAGEGLLPHRQLYVLEVAALLHDIGKIGVPDAILLKPGALGAEEREVMSSHSRMGVEILHSAFSCPQLTEIVRSHTRWFAGDLTASDLPSGAAIPRSARLLRIADAFDSMISPRVYRPARTCAEACAELRRFAGTQFDPELVEHFIAKVGETAAAAQPQIMATVSPQTALNVGLEIQRLAEMIDSQDLCGVCSVAGRLRAIAEKQGIDDIALVAAQLEGRASEHADLAVLLETVRELLNLCRHTQRAYLASAQQRRSGIPSLAP